jgi:hypothetical protein
MILNPNYMDRLSFLKLTGLALGGLTFPAFGYSSNYFANFVSGRPSLEQRKFTSEAVEHSIRKVMEVIRNPELAWLFENCFPNTLDTTVNFKIKENKPDTFVITGDIHAMWLRDSSAQVWPYLPLINSDNNLKQLIKGLIYRQTALIQIDPYANAFNDGPLGSQWESDLTDMKPDLHERKWEIDSLCYPIRLAYHYYKITSDKSPFDQNWLKTAKIIVRTFKEQQRKEGPGPYHFMRTTPKATDTLPGNGYGNPINPVGLICSSFRPSDDATTLPFLIPSNFFAATSLKQMAEISNKVLNDNVFENECLQLAKEVESALDSYAYSEHPKYGKILAFEVDGFLNKLFMDDANVPSILSLPYLGCIDKDDVVYKNTRKFILSADNPWYFKGKEAEGVGGPHVGKDMIWPMSITMQALTSNNDEEITKCIRTLIKTHAGTGFMHETFHKDDCTKYTRAWFAWANTLFGELILKIYNEKKYLLETI